MFKHDNRERFGVVCINDKAEPPRRRSGGVAALLRPHHRAAPRQVRLDLPPIADAADIASAMAAITAAVAEGAITPAEGVEVGMIVETYLRALEASDFDRRLKALETAHASVS